MSELKLDIITNGKIRQDMTPRSWNDGNPDPFPTKEDEKRLKAFYRVQDKYTFGWYIATETLEQQLLSITRFEQYILTH